MAGIARPRPQWKIPSTNLLIFVLAHLLCHVTRGDEPAIPCTAGNEGEYVRDKSDCAVAYTCSELRWLMITCPEGQWFDLNINTCNHNFMVRCSKECMKNPCIQNGICKEIPRGYRCSYPNVISEAKSDMNRLLISQYETSELFILNPVNEGIEIHPSSYNGKPTAFQYVPEVRQLFIAVNGTTKGIVSINLKTTVIKVLREGVVSEGLDVDAGANLLFYSDTEVGTINSMTLSGANHKVLRRRGLRRPKSVVADTVNRKLFYIDLDRDRIESCDYHGENEATIYQMNGLPTALDILPGGDQLFLCNNEDEIWSVTIYGVAKRLYKPAGDLIKCDSIAVYSDRIYTVYVNSEHVYERDMAGVLLHAYNGTGHLVNNSPKTVFPIAVSSLK